MKKKICVLGLLLFSPWAQALDLVEAYERAKATDPNWQVNLLQYEADQLNLGIAKGNLLPTVTVSGNITRRSQDANATSIPDFSSFRVFIKTFAAPFELEPLIAPQLNSFAIFVIISPSLFSLISAFITQAFLK